MARELPDDERRWIARLRGRDETAWEEFVARYRDLVQGVIRQTASRWHRRLQPNDLEDLASDVFAAALRGIERFRSDSQLSTWLVSITRRVANRELSRSERRQSLRCDSGEQPDQAAMDPLENLLLNERRERIEAKLAQLSSKFREVLRLHYLERASYRVISKRLGISVNSVGSLIVRGRRSLRELLRRGADSAEMRMLDAADLKPDCTK